MRRVCRRERRRCSRLGRGGPSQSLFSYELAGFCFLKRGGLTQLCVVVEIPDPHPRVAGLASDELPLGAVQRDAGDVVWRFVLFDRRCWPVGGEEVDRLAGGDAEYAGRLAVQRIGVDFAGPDQAVHGVFSDHGLRAEVPPADFLVVRRRDDDVRIRTPDDALDGALVDVLAQLKAWGFSLLQDARSVGLSRASAFAQIEDAQFLLLAARRENPRVGPWRERDRAYNVVVLELVKSLAGVGVPDNGAEVCAARRAQIGVDGESRVPHGAFVADEGADPVARHAVAHHRVVVFAGRDDEAVAVGVDGREGQMGDGAGVAVAGQGDDVECFCLVSMISNTRWLTYPYLSPY